MHNKASSTSTLFLKCPLCTFIFIIHFKFSVLSPSFYSYSRSFFSSQSPPLQAITLVSPACQITPSVVIRGPRSGEHQNSRGRQTREGGNPLGKSDASDTVNPTICIAPLGNYSREGGIGSISGGFNRDSIQRVISSNGNIVKFYRKFRIHLLSECFLLLMFYLSPVSQRWFLSLL